MRVSWALAALAVAAFSSLCGSATASAAAAPSIDSESVSITATDATLGAQINLNGLETSYQVRLESGCVVDRLACDAINVQSLAGGEIPASSEVQSISIDLNEAGARLHPGTKYAYSIEATNSVGTTTGPGGTFRMPPTGTPSIENESLSHLTPTDATLEAQINTEGLETTYEFKLETVGCSSHGAGCELAPRPVALPSGKLLGSFVGQSVSLDLNSAGVTLGKGEWFYTVTATNADGSATGTFHQFEAPLAGPPAIESESATNVTENDATLEAMIDPNGAYTAYEFQVAATSNFAYPHMACPLTLPGYAQCYVMSGDEPLPPGLVKEPSQGSIPAGSGERSVSLDLASIGAILQPATTYHYRVIAANTSNGQTVEGPDQTFITPSKPSSEPGPTSLDQSRSKAGTQSLPTIHSPHSASLSHHRKHKRFRHRLKVHRAKCPG